MFTKHAKFAQVIDMKLELQLIDDMEKNDAWFRKNYIELQSKYGNKFVAVHDGKLLDSGTTLEELTKKLEEKKIDITLVLVQFVPEKGIHVFY